MMKGIRFRRPPSPESQRNNGSLSIGIVDRDAPSHLISKHPDQSQADATTWDSSAVRAPTETLEHSLTLISWDSRSMVTNMHDNPLCIQAAADLHR